MEAPNEGLNEEGHDSAKETVVIDKVGSCCRRDKEKVEALSVSAFVLVSLQDGYAKRLVKKAIYLHSASSVVWGASYGYRLVMRIKGKKAFQMLDMAPGCIEHNG